MSNTCIHCGNHIVGRSDKRFCAIKCKNQYNLAKKKTTPEIVLTINKNLERNRSILHQLLDTQSIKEFDNDTLIKSGFLFEHITGIFTNKNQTTYYLVYDCAYTFIENGKVQLLKKQTL